VISTAPIACPEPDDSMLLQGYNDAVWLLGDSQTAKLAVALSFSKLSVAETRQVDRDRDHQRRPPKHERRNFYRVTLPRIELFRYLLMDELESWERLQERDNGALTQHHLVQRFIKKGIKETLNRNSFAAATTSCRIYCDYTNPNTLDMYRIAAPNRVLAKDDAACSRLRATIMDKLDARFAGRLSKQRAANGEIRFEARRPSSAEDFDAVRNSVQHFVPPVDVVFPPNLIVDHQRQVATGAVLFPFEEKDSQTENEIELKRIRLFFDEAYFDKLASALGLDEFKKRLWIPVFGDAGGVTGAIVEPGSAKGSVMEIKNPYTDILGDIHDRISHEAGKRRRVPSGGPLSFRVDGTIVGPVEQAYSGKLENANLVEIVGQTTDGEEVVLAAHLLTYGNDTRREMFEVEIAGGDRLLFECDYEDYERVRVHVERVKLPIEVVGGTKATMKPSVQDKWAKELVDCVTRRQMGAALAILNNERPERKAWPSEAPMPILLYCMACLLDCDLKHMGLLDRWIADLRSTIDAGTLSIADAAHLEATEAIVRFHRGKAEDVIDRLEFVCRLADVCRNQDLQTISRYYLARALYRSGDWSRAKAVILQAERSGSADAVLARLRMIYAWMLFNEGNTREAEAQLNQAEAFLSPSDYADRAHVLTMRGRLARRSGQYTVAVSELQRAIELLNAREKSENPRLMAKCHVQLAFVLLLQAESERLRPPDKALGMLQSAAFDALVRARSYGDDPSDHISDQVHRLRGAWYLYLGDLSRALVEAEQSLASAHFSGDPVAVARALLLKCQCALRQHNALDAARLAVEACTAAEGTENRRLKARALIWMGMAELERPHEDHAAARECLRKAQMLVQSSDQDYLRQELDGLGTAIRRTSYSRDRIAIASTSRAEGTSSQTFDSTALLALAGRGDPKESEAAFRRMREHIYRTCVYLLKDRADIDDAIQETLLRVWKGAPSFDPERGNFSAWVGLIARRVCIDMIRRTKSREVRLDVGPDATDSDLESLVAPARIEPRPFARSEAFLGEIGEAWETLLPRDRLILGLRVLEELSYKEIGEMLGCSEMAARVRFTRALGILRKTRHKAR
jgi:RNA polymerase sigma factor (sigma-70 family)